MLSNRVRVRNGFLIVLSGKIFLYTDEDKNYLLYCCNSGTYMVDKGSLQSINETPAKQKCSLRQGSTSYLAFTSADTKFTDDESISDSTDIKHI